jgi:hypothetical protein
MCVNFITAKDIRRMILLKAGKLLILSVGCVVYPFVYIFKRK